MPFDRVVALANLIQQTIEPDTWTPDHGCSIVPFVSKGSTLLVVRQSAGAHDEMIDLFELIQQAQRRGGDR
jgi:hypothetical protein